MRLLYVADMYYPPTLGGSAIAVRRLAHGMAARGHEVQVVAPGHGLFDTAEKDGRTVVIRCGAIPDLRPGMDPRKTGIRLPLLPAIAIRRAMDRFRPDLIHLQVPGYTAATAAVLARLDGTPLVATCHGIPENFWAPGDRSQPLFQAFGRFIWSLILENLERCDAVLAPTRIAADLLRAQGLRKAALPVSNGVDLEVYRPPVDAGERRMLRARFGLPDEGPVVLYAGRFAPEKRLEVLFDAMAHMSPDAAATWAFVGRGVLDPVAELGRRGVDTSRVRMLGLLMDQDMPLIYRAVDVLVLPSEAELQGLVLLEAAASGCALVGARALAIPEAIEHEVTGFLHEPGDAPGLAAALWRLIREPGLLDRMGSAAQEAVRHHAIPACLDRTLAIYEEVMARRERRGTAPDPEGA
ncbi:MAG: glycosyltransferase [Candidatus Sericytochromatia bacterium]|nr:glycosyltransferase [Candidatus Tanganyikabacteria bacterium]